MTCTIMILILFLNRFSDKKIILFQFSIGTRVMTIKQFS